MEQKYKRWYDLDPDLQKLMNVLEKYREELKEQAQIFLDSIEKVVSKEAVESFYAKSKQLNGGKRWYDNDPVISRAVELIRIVPHETQKKVATDFLEALKFNGICID